MIFSQPPSEYGDDWRRQILISVGCISAPPLETSIQCWTLSPQPFETCKSCKISILTSEARLDANNFRVRCYRYNCILIWPIYLLSSKNIDITVSRTFFTRGIRHKYFSRFLEHQTYQKVVDRMCDEWIRPSEVTWSCGTSSTMLRYLCIFWFSFIRRLTYEARKPKESVRPTSGPI